MVNQTKRVGVWWWVGLLVVALLVRCVGMGRFDMGTDEGHSYVMVTSGGSLWEALRNDTNPPLYFLLLRGSVSVFGTSLSAMRMMSVVLGVMWVGGLGGLVQRCGGTARMVKWVLVLAALSPVQLFYAQEARGYTLGCLLVVLGMWTFVDALESGGRVGAWVAHGVAVAVGAYAHNVLVPVAGGYVLAGMWMGVSRRTWVAMGVTYAGVAVAAVPALGLMMEQARHSGGTAWLRGFWEMTPPALAIPKSLGVLGLGGDMPAYVMTAAPGWSVRMMAVVLTGVGMMAAVWPGQKELGRYGRMAGIFAVWPLVFLWGYSVMVRPIYLVGRYDLFAQGAVLMVLAGGFSRVQGWMENAGGGMVAKDVKAAQTIFREFVFRIVGVFRGCLSGMGAWGLPVAVGVVLVAGMWGRWFFPLPVKLAHHELRAEYVKGVVGEDGGSEGIVCTGLEGSPTIFRMAEAGLAGRVAVSTFPLETVTHIGWLMDDAEIVRRREAWGDEGLAALRGASDGGRKRVWVFADAAAWEVSTVFAPSPRQVLTFDLIGNALAHGWVRAERDPARRAREDELRIMSLVYAGPPGN